MMRKLLLIFVTNLFLNGQVANTPDLIPPTPQTFNFSVFNSAFTNTSSGEFTYDIPIHNVTAGSFSLPVSLSYRSGVKVDDLGSNTGISWQLNGGGVISRVVRDMPDETAFKRWIPENINVISDVDKIKEAAIPGQYMDTEYDWFNFNVSNGFSGSFYLDGALNPVYSGDDYIITKIKNSTPNGKKYLEFTITDKVGNKYFFGGQKKYVEETTIMTSNNSGVPYPHLKPMSATGWFLYKITTPAGHVVMLDYESDSYNFFSSVDSSLNIDEICACDFNNGQDLYNTSIVDSKTLSSVDGTRLISIQTTNEKLVFAYTKTRNDVDGSLSSLLTSIELKNANGNIIENNELSYSDYTKDAETYYFPNFNNNTGSRYFLNQIKKINSKQTYKLDYYSPETLPARFSLSSDYYGYFNGKLNSRPFPKITDFNSAEIRAMWPIVKNKVPADYISAIKDVDPNLVQIGNLKKITYPTSGTTTILYEPNKTTEKLQSENHAMIDAELHLLCNASSHMVSNTQTITSNGSPIEFKVDDVTLISCYGTPPDETKYSIKVRQGGTLVKSIVLNHIGFPSFETDEGKCLTDDKFCPVQTTAGLSYEITFELDGKINKTWSMDGRFEAKYNREDILVDTEVYYAGARVSKIIENDSEGKEYDRNFYYNTYANKNSASSSINFNIPPRFYYTRFGMKNCLSDCGCYGLPAGEESTLCTIGVDQGSGPFPETKSFGFTTNSLLNNFNNRSNKPYYSIITDVIDGKSVEESFYYDNEDTPSLTFEGTQIFNLPYSNSSFNKQGKIEKKILYGFNNNIIKRISIDNYTYTGTNNIKKSFVYYQNYLLPPFSPVPNTYIANISIGEYYNHYGDTKISQINKEEIINSNSLYSITTNEYTSPNHRQLTAQKIILPDLTVRQNLYKYAHEKGKIDMVMANMVGIPLETEIKKYKNANDQYPKTISKSGVKYATKFFDAEQVILPDVAYSYDVQNPSTATTEIKYNEYDDKGNVLQYTLKPDLNGDGGNPVVIIWGYNQTQPIAKIEGATYTQVASLATTIITASNTDALQSANNDETSLLATMDTFRQSFPNNQVTTYTYDPLIGVRSITPPSGIRENYIYDTANRLQSVKDNNGNILKEYDYKYKP